MGRPLWQMSELLNEASNGRRCRVKERNFKVKLGSGDSSP